MGVRIPFKNGRETTDEVALLKVNRKYGLPIVPLLLEYREANKLKTTYCAIPLESDGKIRFTLGIAGTKTGRFNSNRTPWDTGCNAQNLPKEFRAVVVADPGKTLVQVDLSQAELRVVAWQYAADQIAKTTGMQVSRHLGKTINHSGSYGAGASKLCDIVLKQCGIAITEDQARAAINARKHIFPGLYAWQEEVVKEVRKTRTLTTPTGLKRTFYGRVDDDPGTTSSCEIMNFIPQSLVADVLNAGWIKLYSYMLLRDGTAEVLQQGHDSLLFQVRPSKVDALCDIIDKVFSRIAIPISGRNYTIPHDIHVGPNWRDMKERK
jgi:DNA polymerase I-like protein with 3'-5' exonuclease and polymerase domains